MTMDLLSLPVAERHSHHGFLPVVDPLRRLPSLFDDWEEAAAQLPRLLTTDRVRSTVAQLPPFPTEALTHDREWERALTLLGFLGHAYVWQGDEPARVLPTRLAVAWHAVAARLGLPPVLTYSSYVLQNYQRLDPTAERAGGNLAVLQPLVGGCDEAGFVLSHVELEHKAAPAIAVLHACLDAVRDNDAERLESGLTTVHDTIAALCASLCQLRKRCDPQVYYHQIRPYLHGWKGHPVLTDGVIYDGVAAYGGAPQQFRGPSGAQSAVFAALDLLLGIDHRDDGLAMYLRELRTYMPPAQRTLLASLEARGSVRPFVVCGGSERLVALYDACIDGLDRFRSLHLQFAAAYIAGQKHPDPRNPTDRGTGGTSFMKDLNARRHQTAHQRLRPR